MVVHYKVFANDELFVDWQNNLKTDMEILQLVPVTVYEEEGHTGRHNSIGIFVTYTEG